MGQIKRRRKEKRKKGSNLAAPSRLQPAHYLLSLPGPLGKKRGRKEKKKRKREQAQGSTGLPSVSFYLIGLFFSKPRPKRAQHLSVAHKLGI